ncbi:hypothetical protein SLE2022_319140 [Rubroshorea leprosula]
MAICMRKMATNYSFGLCFLLILFVSFSGSESRPIFPFPTRNQALFSEGQHHSSKEISGGVTQMHSSMEVAELVLKESMKRQEGKPFEEFTRTTPGEPDRKRL